MSPYNAYFVPIFLTGCLVSVIASAFAAYRQGCAIPGVLLSVGTLSFWAAMFIGSDLGYRAWQSLPNAPDEAFSDASVGGALILGWLPGGVFCLVVFLVTRGFRRLSNWANPPPAQVTPTTSVPESADDNPYQRPASRQ